jgi:hypothetical protein
MNRETNESTIRQIEFELEKAMSYDGERAAQLRHMPREARKRKLSNRLRERRGKRDLTPSS